MRTILNDVIGMIGIGVFLAFHRFDCVLEDTSAIKALTGK